MTVFDHQFGLAEESAYGTPVLPVVRFYEVKPGSGFDIQPQGTASDGIRAGRSTKSADMSVRRRPTISGQFEHDIQTKGFGLLGKLIFGSVATSGPVSGKYTHTLTVSEPGRFTGQEGIGRPTATTMPVTATGCKITDAAFAGEVGGLLGCTFSVDARVAWTLTTLTGGTTTGSNVVTMASTAGVSLDQPVTGTGIPASSMVGSVINNTSITLINQTTRAAANATTTNASTSLTFGTALASASYPASSEPFLCDSISISIGGVTVAAAGFELTMNPQLKTDRTKMVAMGLKDEPIRAALSEFSVSLKGITYDADTFTNRIVAATSAGAQAQVIITAIGQNDPAAQAVFTLPAVEFRGGWPMMDEGLVEFDLEGDCWATAAGASPVTLAYTTVDTTP